MLAAICFGGQLSSVLHLALVRHATCKEHGELIHADGAGPARHVRGVASFEVAGPSPRHGHDHCQVPSQRSQGILVSRAAASAAIFAATEAVVVTHDQSNSQSVPLLLLAPKSSPPA